jgi:hypothetical protein
MPLYLFNDVFLLYLTLEAAEGIFQRLTLLYPYFRQYSHPQTVPFRIE